MKSLLCLLLLLKLVTAEFSDYNLTESIKQMDSPRARTRLPAEWERHKRTFMVWPQSEEIWSAELLPQVRNDIASIANALVRFEPVVMLVDPEQVDDAKSQLHRRVEVVPMLVDDLWARDTLPVFVLRTRLGVERIRGIIFNFNGWGNKQIHANDALVAQKVVEKYRMSSKTASIVAEGGSFETDGRGTLLVTKSSLVNTNRNSQSQDEIEAELKDLLGVRKVIWFEGVAGKDITDAHVDCLVRFVRPGVVILNRPFPGQEPDVWSISSDDAAKVLETATDARGRRLRVIDLVEPDPDKIIIKGNATTFLASYANFLIGNGVVLMPAFGDTQADEKARSTLQRLFPGRRVISLLISTLASGGGGIHCATHDEPQVMPRTVFNIEN